MVATFCSLMPCICFFHICFGDLQALRTMNEMLKNVKLLHATAHTKLGKLVMLSSDLLSQIEFISNSADQLVKNSCVKLDYMPSIILRWEPCSYFSEGVKRQIYPLVKGVEI